MTTIETMKQTPASPGSYSEFLSSHPELDQEQAATAYYDSLEGYRNELAGYYGISREELHDMSFRRIGSIPTQALAEA